MCFHMVLSDSFVHRNCSELLDTSFLSLKRERTELLQAFRKKYLFFDQISDILSRCGFSEFDLYIDGVGSSESIEDFEQVETDQNNLLSTLFCCIFESKGKYAFCFPPLRVHVVLAE